MLRVFLRLTSSTFLTVVGEDAHEILTIYMERYTLALVESRRAKFISYHLDKPTMQW